jgi:hypothetical protein
MRGMPPAIFERSANLLCVESPVFTIDIEAQMFVRGRVHSEAQRATAPIAAARHFRVVVQRDYAGTPYAAVRECEQQRAE